LILTVGVANNQILSLKDATLEIEMSRSSGKGKKRTPLRWVNLVLYMAKLFLCYELILSRFLGDGQLAFSLNIHSSPDFQMLPSGDDRHRVSIFPSR